MTAEIVTSSDDVDYERSVVTVPDLLFSHILFVGGSLRLYKPLGFLGPGCVLLICGLYSLMGHRYNTSMFGRSGSKMEPPYAREEVISYCVPYSHHYQYPDRRRYQRVNL